MAWAIQRARLIAIRQVDAERRPVREQLDHVADALAANDDHHFADPHAGEGLDRVVDHRAVVDRQQVLVGDDRQWVEAGRRPAGKNDAFHRREA
jgi:hypothetical protein